MMENIQSKNEDNNFGFSIEPESKKLLDSIDEKLKEFQHEACTKLQNKEDGEENFSDLYLQNRLKEINDNLNDLLKKKKVHEKKRIEHTKRQDIGAKSSEDEIKNAITNKKQWENEIQNNEVLKISKEKEKQDLVDKEKYSDEDVLPDKNQLSTTENEKNTNNEVSCSDSKKTCKEYFESIKIEETEKNSNDIKAKDKKTFAEIEKLA